MLTSSVSASAIRLVRAPRCLRPLTWSLAAALLVLPLAGCKRPQAPQQRQMPPAAVTVAAATARDVPLYIDAIGKALAVETVSIVPQVGGKIIAAHVGDGDTVHKGQLLFEIDPRPFEATLASAKATLAQNKADLELARIEFNRTQELANRGTASQLEYDQDRVALAVAQARMSAAEAAVNTAELNLAYTKIFSPIDGRAGARLVDAGNVVRENDAPLQVLRRLDPIYVEFTVPENELGAVRQAIAAQRAAYDSTEVPGLAVEVTIPGNSERDRAVAEVVPNGTAPTSAPAARSGRVTFLDSAVQGSTGSIKLRATVANADSYLWPGQFVNVRLILATLKDAVLVPTDAQQIGQQGPYVYVVGADSIAQLRPIVPGQRQGSLLVVEKGVAPGENVVVAGHMMVRPQAPVTVVNGAPGTPPAAAGEAAAAAALAPEQKDSH